MIRIKLKDSTKEEILMMFFAVPIMIFCQAGLLILLGSTTWLYMDVWLVIKITGLIFLSQLLFYSRFDTYYWLKHWKKRNIKNGVMEI